MKKGLINLRCIYCQNGHEGASPRPNAQHEPGAHLQTLLSADLLHLGQPRASVFYVEHAPGEGASNSGIEPATHAHGEAEGLILDRVIAPLGKVRNLTLAPLLQELFPQSWSLIVAGYPSSSKHHLREGREATGRARRPAGPDGKHDRIPTFVFRHVDDLAAVHLAYNLPCRIDPRRALPTAADAISAAQKAL